MNNLQMIHIGSELIIICGISLFFFKENKNIKMEINKLKEENEKMKNQISNLQEKIKH